MTTPGPFRFEYDPPVLQHGAECVQQLDVELGAQGLDRGLVVCGQTVGSTPAVMDQIEAGLGERLAGVCASTTPEKRLATAIDAAQQFAARDADCFVAVGGGSSLDVAKVASVVAGSDRDPATLANQLVATGALSLPSGDLPPVIAVPTTLAGADLSMLAGISVDPASGLGDESVSGGVGDPRLMPAAVFYDPQLVKTTPRDVLAGSAMNGFNKGIETLYARNRTPLTDATAVRGLQLLSEGLPTLETKDPDQWALDTILEGIMLVQYGISRADGTTLSVLHAFGHGLRTHTGMQQGVAHAIVTPHALSDLFEHVDGRQELLARALTIEQAGSTPLATAIVEAVRTIRNALGLPTRLLDVTGVEKSQFTAIAEATHDDHLLENVPPGYDPTIDQLEAILEAAW